MRSWLVPALLITIAIWIPVPGAAANCWWITETVGVTPIGEFYMKGSAQEFWRESNGLAGFQRHAGGCDDGTRIPSDTCLTDTEPVIMKKCLDRQLDERGI